VYAGSIFNAAVTANAAVTVAGLLTANGNTQLGSSTATGQTLTVYATSTFSAAVTVAGQLTANANAQLGSSSSQTLVVNAVSTFNAPVTANSDVSIALAGTLTARGNVVLGSQGNNRSLTVTANTTLFNSSEVGASVTVANTSTFAANGNVSLGTNRSNALTVNSESAFYGAVTGNVGVQVRSVVITPTAVGLVIPATVSFVDASANTASGNLLKLPIPVMGLQISIQAGATQFGVVTYNSSFFINGDTTNSTHTLYPYQLASCTAASATNWYCSVSGYVYSCALGICTQSPFKVGQTF